MTKLENMLENTKLGFAIASVVIPTLALAVYGSAKWLLKKQINPKIKSIPLNWSYGGNVRNYQGGTK